MTFQQSIRACLKQSALFMLLIMFGALTGTAHAADGVFDSNGARIRYVTAGEGEAVVLIHGWMADSSMWGADASGNTKLDTKDTDGFQLIALDCRGHGKSDKPHDIEKYGAEMAADVVRLLDHLEIRKAHLIGYSSGAFIAGKVAATHPDRVRSVVYAAQAPLITGVRPSVGTSEVEVFAKAVEEGKSLGAYILEVTPDDKPKPTAEQADAIAAYLYAGKDVKALATAGLSFKSLKVSESELKKYKGPILFIHGGNESEYVKSSVASARGVIGRGEVVIIEGGDHMTTLIKPEFGAKILEFLRANGAGASGPRVKAQSKGE